MLLAPITLEVQIDKKKPILTKHKMKMFAFSTSLDGCQSKTTDGKKGRNNLVAKLIEWPHMGLNREIQEANPKSSERRTQAK